MWGKEVHRVLSSTEFQKVWNNGNRRAHATLVAVLSGQNTKLTGTRNGDTIVINIEPVATKVIDKLDAKGIHFFDPLKRVFTDNKKSAGISILSANR